MSSIENKVPSVCAHFSLRYTPFSDTFPLAEPCLADDESRDLTRMLMLIGEGKSFTLVGEPGSGKSMLLKQLAARLDSKHYRVAQIPYSGIKPLAVLREICEQLKVDSQGRCSLVSRLHKSLARSNDAPYAVILLDEAHLLSKETMHELFSLTHDPVQRTAAASIVLCGHLTLEKMLGLDSFLAVRTRISMGFTMKCLNDKEVQQMIAHRLAAVKATPDLFHDDAVALIALDSKGNRRSVMNLAGNCMTLAVLRGEKIISHQLAKEVCNREAFTR